MEFNKFKLKELLQVNPRMTLKKGSKAKKIAMENIKEFQKKIDNFTIEEFKSGSKFQNGDTLLARITPCLENGKTAYVDILEDDEIAFGSTEFFVLRPIDNKLDSQFLYYLFRTKKVREIIIKSMTGTSGRQRAQKDSILEYKCEVPTIEYQRKIAIILKNLDDKIEINKKIIANLEELSQTLFKHWFVDFEFPNEDGNPYKSSGGEMIDSELGKIPKGWIVKSLDEIANYINGLAMQKYPANKEESLPIVKIKELKNGFTDDNSNRCTTEIPEKAKIDNGDIIFSWSATLLVKMWTGGKAGLNQHLFKVTSETFPKWFYYLWTKRYIEYFINIANDKATTMGHINRKHLSHAKVVLPTQLQLENFDKIFHNLLEKQLNTEEELKRLIDLRDTLLPKLMSGELEIPNDIEVNSDELSI
ncbi:restriction endonuclease subunit S [Staphylococcus hominis]|uniref:restriction endonuclease subunit S n=1 Tax=Staphylococcus hominis TaxID=1290 RepID=UPI001F57F3FB|nr:restriction endonuclease subunit S [Staphylococcus hominis]MCI2838457.1 restriction endonuclease subunit S [Staphylococcus hominis]